MIHFIEYLPSGQIVRSGTAVVTTVADITPLAPGYTIRALATPQPMEPNSYWDGIAVSHLPAQPSKFHVVDWAVKAWVDPRTLQDHKDAKWAEIKAAREAAEFGPFTWDGSSFDGNTASQQRLAGAVQMAAISSNFTVDWTLANNAVRAFSATQVIAVGVALAQHVAAQYSTARGLRAQIEAATTLTQVAAVAWS